MAYVASDWEPKTAVPSEQLIKSAALQGGTLGMLAQGQKFLPSFPGEKPAAYQARLKLAYLFPEFERLARDFTGRVLGAAPIYPQQMSQEWQSFTERADYFNRSLHQVLRSGFQLAVADGMCFSVVDSAARKPGETALDAMALRPWIEIHDIRRVVNWSTRLVGGELQLTAFRMEPEKDLRSEYILLPDGRVQLTVYRKGEKGWLEQEGFPFVYPPAITRIPVAPMYSNRSDYFQARMPLEAVADMNIAHFQSNSDYRNILSFVGIPVVWGTNLDLGLTLSPGATFISKGPDTVNLQFLELGGKSIESLVQQLKDIEKKMQDAGLQQTQAQLFNQTATGEVLQQKREASRLQVMAMDYEAAANDTMRNVAMFLGQEWYDEGLRLKGNFEQIERNKESLAEVRHARDVGAISNETYLQYLIDYGIWADNTSVQDIIAAETSQQPSAGGIVDGEPESGAQPGSNEDDTSGAQ